MEDFLIGAPNWITPLDREKITPWTTFVDHHDFRIERQQIGNIETEDSLRLLQRYGICQLRLSGQAPDEATLRAYFEPIGSAMDKQNNSQGDVKDIKPTPLAEPITGDSSGDLGFHVDGTQTPDQPALLAFQYVEPADLKGDSRFIDMAAILLQLPDDVRENILVDLARPDAAIFEKDGNSLTSPIFHMPDGESVACRMRIDGVISVNPACRESYEILREALLDERNGVKFKPQKGDIIVFDNWRVLHARDAVLGNNQRHHRRVWMDALLEHHQAHFKLGIRPVSARVKARILDENTNNR